MFSIRTTRPNYLSFIPWSIFTAISNSTPAKLTILIPLIGYMIIFNDKLGGYLSLASEIAGSNEKTAVSPRLTSIYLGLCDIAIGVAIYSWLCPPGVKYYVSENAYVAGVKDVSGDFAMEKIEQELRESPLTRDAYIKIRNRFVDEDQKQEIYNGCLRLYFGLLNLKYPAARVAVAIFYVMGFTLLLVPSLKVFFSVSLILIRTAA